MGETITAITVEDLDLTVKSTIQKKIFIKLNQMFQRADVTMEQFGQALEDGLRDDITKEIKDYYAFLGDVEVELDDAKLYEIL